MANQQDDLDLSNVAGGQPGDNANSGTSNTSNGTPGSANSDTGNTVQTASSESYAGAGGSGGASPSASSTQSAASAGSASGTSPTYAAPQKGTGFVNLQNMINANQNNGLGNAVQSGVSNAANSANTAINNAQNTFNTQTANNNYDTGANQQYITNTFGNIASGAGLGANGDLNTYASDPNGVNAFGSTVSTGATTSTGVPNTFTATQAGSQGNDNTNASSNSVVGGGTAATNYSSNPFYNANDQANFQQFVSGVYNGPQSLGNLSSLQQNAQDVNNIGNYLNSGVGQQALLQRFVGNGQNYNQGENALDSALLGETGAPQLAQARLAAQGVQNVNQLNAGDQAIAQTMGQNAKDLQSFVYNQATGVGNQLGTGLTGLAQHDQDKANAALNALQGDISNNKISAADQATLQGLGININGPVFGGSQDLTNLFQSIGAQTYNASNVANSNQLAAQQALSQLSGLDTNKLGLGAGINTSAVGTAASGPLSINQSVLSAFNNLQNTDSTNYNTAYKNAGLINQSDLDYLNSAPIQSEIGALGALYNQLPADQTSAYVPTGPNGGQGSITTTNPGDPGVQAQINSLIGQLSGQLQGQDKTAGSTDLEQYVQQLQAQGGLGQYGSQRSYDQGEGVSQWNNAIKAQAAKEQQLVKGNNYFNNLQTLLGAQPVTFNPVTNNPVGSGNS